MESTDTGFNLGLVIYLKETRNFEPLTPWQKGTWLDQAIFDVRCKEKEEAAEVNYLELTNELRDKFKYINLSLITSPLTRTCFQINHRMRTCDFI